MHQPKGMTADITPAKILMALLRPRNDCTTSGTVTKLLRRSHFCNQRDEQQRGGAEHAIEQNGQAEVIGVADMTDQNAAAHCGGKLSADDNVVREITTADLPVGQIGFSFFC